MTLNLKELALSVDFSKGVISSLIIRGRERLAAPSPLFRTRLRDVEGNTILLTSYDARSCLETEDGAIYTDFPCADLTVHIRLSNECEEAAWRIAVTPASNLYLVEWVELAPVTLPLPEDNNPLATGGKILFPYNEGVLISNLDCREESVLRYTEAEYPSMGSYGVFPNMVCSQMLAYLWKDAGLYLGAHDEKRGVKDVNFLRENGGVTLRFRLFCGGDFGSSYESNDPIVFSVTDGNWESAAERYRRWFESALPSGAKKIVENPTLPEWYRNAPLVVSYPVRGTHDMDEMLPNRFYPYMNAMPILDEIRQRCDSQLLVLLMHWEGTAPWAPPYVWPPFGGEEPFHAFLHALHEKGDLLGVYCSGFGYTLQSNLIADYNKEKEYAEQSLWRGMCSGPNGHVAISKICQGQRSGYDICPASEIGRAILDDAYAPLLSSNLDYVQILDQNHGGGQYFCYSKEHGHAPSPGAWMTEHMQTMLTEWNRTAGKTLFGCESAAAEPFIGMLLFSDNRYELNYRLGVAVPFYAYIYHEYVRNFMGNQVSCPFRTNEDTIRYRLAYSFCAGDCMTLVVTPSGELASHWGMKDFSCFPSKEKALQMIANLTRFYREQGQPYLYAGRMIASPTVTCESITFARRDSERTVTLPAILSSAWESQDGSRALILVNPEDHEAICTVNGIELAIPPLDGILFPLA